MGSALKRAIPPALGLASLLLPVLLTGCAGRTVHRSLLPLDAVVLPLLTTEAKQGTEAGPDTGSPGRLLKQYVVLLPDDDGSVGAIDVSNGKTTVTLDQPYQAVSFDKLTEPYTISGSEVKGDFAPTVAHLPRPPMSFTLYFDYASPQLNAASREALPAILAEIASRSALTVSIHGHTDRAGAAGNNERMSRRRAEAVRDLLIANGVAADSIDLEGYGEGRPAIATDDGVREAGNRRVEIRIR